MFDNVKSKIILKKIMEHIRPKKKLKILKINQKLLNRLNITIKDFQRFEKIKKINQEYGLNIGEEEEIINFNMGFKKYKILEDFSELKLEKLEKLNLNYNEIANIDLLEKAEFPNLKILILSNNFKSNINILKKFNFKE